MEIELETIQKTAQSDWFSFHTFMDQRGVSIPANFQKCDRFILELFTQKPELFSEVQGFFKEIETENLLNHYRERVKA